MKTASTHSQQWKESSILFESGVPRQAWQVVSPYEMSTAVRRDTPMAPVASPKEVQRWGEARGLSEEQIEAAKLVLCAPHGIVAIQGYAGAAKTTVVGAIREFAEEHGYLVRGFAMTTGAVLALLDAGIKAETMDSLLANPLPLPTGPELWFVDESSLVSTRKANEILEVARELRIERLAGVATRASTKASRPAHR